MGSRMFLDTLGLYGSCVISLLGVLEIIIVAYFYLYVEIAKSYSGPLVGMIVVGVFLILLGIIGFFGYALERSYKWPIRLFAVLLVLILITSFILAIVAVAMTGSLKKLADKAITAYCELGELNNPDDSENIIMNSKCFPIVRSVVYYLCDGEAGKDDPEKELDPCPSTLKENGNCKCADNLGDKVGNMTKSEFYDATVEYTVLLLKANYVTVGVLAFLVVAFLLVMLITLCASCMCYETDEEKAKKEEEKKGIVRY